MTRTQSLKLVSFLPKISRKLSQTVLAFPGSVDRNTVPEFINAAQKILHPQFDVRKSFSRSNSSFAILSNLFPVIKRHQPAIMTSRSFVWCARFLSLPTFAKFDFPTVAKSLKHSRTKWHVFQAGVQQELEILRRLGS